MRRILLLLVAAMFSTTLGVLGQGVTTGSLTGIVKDAKGEVIPGANVVATHKPSGTTYGTVSQVDGHYNFPAMRVGGPYTVKASFVGYKEMLLYDVVLELGQTLVLDFGGGPSHSVGRDYRVWCGRPGVEL